VGARIYRSRGGHWPFRYIYIGRDKNLQCGKCLIGKTRQINQKNLKLPIADF
jgi:hypothetical protein